MPELPEVESFARHLHSHYSGHVLDRVDLHREGLRFPFNKKALSRVLRPGAVLRSVTRCGKQLVFQFDEHFLFVSLGMSGAFASAVPGRPQKHEHLTFHFRGLQNSLGYVDPRRFGYFSLVPPPAAASPLDSDEIFGVLLRLQRDGSRRRLRDVLLDQTVLAGVGNIYMCEACFAAAVHPCQLMSDLTSRQMRALASALPVILSRAIRLGGSSISTYRQFDGAEGEAQRSHQVYGRQGQKCLRNCCRGTVERTSVGGRGVFFCKQCQHLGPKASRSRSPKQTEAV